MFRNLKNKVPLFLVLLAAFLASRWLFKPGYFPMHDDLQVGRLFQMDRCFSDKQFPCRWVPDMGFGYGYPLFNFYPPLPYYIGEIFHLLGLSFIDSVKLLFSLVVFLSGLSMYWLAKEFWGVWGGAVSAIFYIWAPYHAVDLYVRGAMNELWATAFFPLIFWATLKVLREGRRYLLILSLSYAGLLLSHNIMSMLFSPLIPFWVIFLVAFEKKGESFFVFIKKRWRRLFLVVSGIFWGVGLAAFFVLPAFFEKSFVHVETMFIGYFNYLAHFVSLRQLFWDRSWGYGASVWGDDDGMPFQVGIIHWALGGVVFLFFVSRALRYFWRRKKLSEIYSSDNIQTVLVVFFGVFFLLSVFLTHPRSLPLWKLIQPLRYLQFPWRFLGLAAFFLSFIEGGIVWMLRNSRVKIYLSLFLGFLVIAFNFSYFQPERMLAITDQDKIFSPKSWYKLQTDAIFDYLPKSAPLPPTSPAPSQPEIWGEGKMGEVVVKNFRKGSNWMSVEVNSSKRVVLLFPSFYFPGWKAWLDKKPSALRFEKRLGRILVEVPKGEHQVYLRLTDTPLRSWANFISLFSWWGFLGFLFSSRIWKLISKN